MKTNRVFLTIAVAATGIFTLCSFINSSASQSPEETDAHAHGKHCNYTVGCDCPGFSPITNGTVAQESVCRHCGHHRSYHR